jgi:hypothetical protein
MTERCEMCGQPLASSPFNGLDWPAFGLQVRLTMAQRNLSYREVASLIGGDQATIHRVGKHGKPIRAETYLALAEWMKEPQP